MPDEERDFDLDEFIPLALRTESKPTVEVCNRLVRAARSLHAVMGLETETGELMDQFKRHIFYGSPLDEVNIKEEVGDLLWYLALLLDEHQISFQDCAATVIAKLKARYPDKFTQQDATVRDLTKEREVLEGQQPRSY